MSDEVPGWLAAALTSSRAGHARLAIAELADERSLGRGGFSLGSPAFGNGEALDPCFTADEEDAVAPPLEWSAPPPGAQELAIIVEDPDAEGGGPEGDGARCHWLVWGLPAQKGKLLEGEVPPRVGKNSQKNSEWLLPDIPPDKSGGKTAHDFVFQIFALELPLTLMPGAGRDELIAEMRGNVKAAAVLTGTYEGYADEEEWDDEEASVD